MSWVVGALMKVSRMLLHCLYKGEVICSFKSSQAREKQEVPTPSESVESCSIGSKTSECVRELEFPSSSVLEVVLLFVPLISLVEVLVVAAPWT